MDNIFSRLVEIKRVSDEILIKSYNLLEQQRKNQNLLAKVTVGAMPVISKIDSFVGSDKVLKSLFDTLNGNFFNNGLKGISVKWLTDLKTRTAVSLIGKSSSIFHTQTFICLSKTLLAKCTRKQLVESLLVRIFLHQIFRLQTIQCIL